MPRAVLFAGIVLCLSAAGAWSAAGALDGLDPNPIRAVISADIEEPFEILEDGAFETGDADPRLLSPFAPFTPTTPTITRTPDAARAGDYGYRISCSSGQWGDFALRVDPDKAESVTLRCWARTESGTATVRPLISFEDYGALVDGPFFGDEQDVTTEWTELTLTTSTRSGFQFAYAGIQVPEESVLYADDFSVTVPVWSMAEPEGDTSVVGGVTVQTAPVAPVFLCFSIHIEDPQLLITNEAYFLRKTAVFERLASLFHSHGGYLNIQPELEWVLAANMHGVPNTLRDLAEDYGVTYSTHTHGPVCYNIATGVPYGSEYCASHFDPEIHSRDITDAHVVNYVGWRQDAIEAASGVPVMDHNGNFDLIEKGLLYPRGIRTLSAFKNPATQKSYDYLVLNPWRPSDADALTDLETFLTHDPDGSLIYIPGLGSAVTRRHRRVEEKVRRIASQFLSHADADRVNTMNLVFHVDSFTSEEDISPDDYISVTGTGSTAVVSPFEEFEAHLQCWDEMLTNVIDPLVAGGYLEWATHAEMAEAFQVWEMEQAGTWLLKVPSDAGGEEGIGVRVEVPESARYTDGAPVAVHVEGGTSSGGLTMDGVGLTEQGFVEVYFNFPGSGALNPSGGVYDNRGPNCLAALRDVTRFALGLTTSTTGQTLADLVDPITPLNDNVGLVGFSNGGNATLTAAGLHGADMPGLAWIVNYESPVGDGMPTADAGAKGYEAIGNPERNAAYDPDTGAWDLSSLKYDETLDVADYLGLGAQTLLGGLYFDHNENDALDPIEDYVPKPFYQLTGGNVVVYYSERLTNFAAARALYPPPALKPEHLTTPEECGAFWYHRNGEKWLEDVLVHNPELMLLVTAHEVDHVQTALDHPHVLIQYEGLREAGARFVRVNPDRAYVEGVTGREYASAIDNDALQAFGHLSVRTAVQPSGADAVTMFANVAAGCCELADRTYSGNVEPQIDYAIPGPTDARNWMLY